MLKTYLVAGAGGALGVMFRLFLAKIFPTHWQQFPLYILLVNILGCFLLGLLYQFFTFVGHFPLMWRSFIVTGFLGGLTTFSACVLEMSFLFEKNQWLLGCVYGGGSILSCFIAFMLGALLIRLFF